MGLVRRDLSPGNGGVEVTTVHNSVLVNLLVFSRIIFDFCVVLHVIYFGNFISSSVVNFCCQLLCFGGFSSVFHFPASLVRYKVSQPEHA